MRIHAIDSLQPPGIGMSPMADMDAHQAIVSAVLAVKSSAETPTKACWEARSEGMSLGFPFGHLRFLVVLVVAAPPHAGLVAAFGCAVEPLVHAPETVHAARVAGIGVVDDAVFEHERAHSRPLARVGGRVGSAHSRAGHLPAFLAFAIRRLAAVVVFDTFLALLLLGEPDAVVEVEVTAE